MADKQEEPRKKIVRKKHARFLTVKVAPFGTLNRPNRSKTFEKGDRIKSDSCVNISELGLVDESGEEEENAGGYDDNAINTSQNPRLSRKTSVVSTTSSIYSEEAYEKYSLLARQKTKELLTTEKNYVDNMSEIVDGYYHYMENSKKQPVPEGIVKMPVDLTKGKDRIVLGNIIGIHDFHKRVFLPELEAASNDPSAICSLFDRRKDALKEKYGKFCINKPKSEYIISQHKHYFKLIQLSKNFQHSLNSQLMTPIQQVTRYPLLLREIEHLYEKSGDVVKQQQLSNAFKLAHEVADYANDMIIAGRIRGFAGDVTRQGLLLMRGEATCYKRKLALKRPKPRLCMIFVFRETIIVCEKAPPPFSVGNKSNMAVQLDYWVSFQINSLIVRETTRDSSACFELERAQERRPVGLTRRMGSANSRQEEPAIIVKCESVERRNMWLKIINDQIRLLTLVATELSNPQLKHKA